MAGSRKICISLPARLHDQVQKVVAQGRYGSVSEVIREALRDWAALRPQHPDMPPVAGTALDVLVQRVRPLCERYAINALWMFGDGSRDFAIEFSAGSDPERQGKWARFAVELELLLLEPVRLVDLEWEVDPDFILHFETSRRLLYARAV